jgi:hypothetical protein
MRSSLITGYVLFGLTVAAIAGVLRGTLLNDDEPYFIKGDDGNIYKAEWYGGSTLWSEGDRTILTGDCGRVKMISPDDDDKISNVWVEDVELAPSAGSSDRVYKSRMNQLAPPLPDPERRRASGAEVSTGTHLGTYRDAQPGEPFSLGGNFVYSLQSVDSRSSGRRKSQILLVKEWVTNVKGSATAFALQSECSIEIWDKNSNRVAEVDQPLTDKNGHVAQSLNQGQTALFWECFEVPEKVTREGFKVEFITEHDRVYVPMVPVSGALAH